MLNFAKCAGLSVAILIIATSCNAIAAEDCKLVREASLDMTPTDDGRIFVPAKIEGQARLFMLDTGAPISTVEADTVAQLGLKTTRLFEDQLYNSLGQTFTAVAHINSFTLDTSTASTIKMAVDPSRLSDEPQFAGLLGADILRNYDIELDFANRKVNLFSQNHCDGKVVYWPADVVAVVPVHVVHSGHIIMPVTLDDQNINALFDTGAGYSHLDLSAAQNLFHLGKDKLQLEGDRSGVLSRQYYSYVFKTLALEGITIGHPKLVIEDDMAASAVSHAPPTGTRLASASESGGSAPMIFGLQQMKKLHIFIAYKEGKLYITPAAAKPVASPAGSSPAANNQAAPVVNAPSSAGQLVPPPAPSSPVPKP